jgi:hypothetical protein
MPWLSRAEGAGLDDQSVKSVLWLGLTGDAVSVLYRLLKIKQQPRAERAENAKRITSAGADLSAIFHM